MVSKVRHTVNKKRKSSSSKAASSDDKSEGPTTKKASPSNDTIPAKKTSNTKPLVGEELDKYPKDEQLYVKEMIRLHTAGVHKPTKVETTTMTAKDDGKPIVGESAQKQDNVGVVSKKAKLMSDLEDEGLVYVTETKTVKSYKLTAAGLKKFSGLLDVDVKIKKEDFANNDSLRSRIIANAYHSSTADQIWKFLEEHGREGMSKKKLVESLGIAGGSSNPYFFYSLEGLRNLGIVEEVKPVGQTKFVRLVKTNAFVDPPPQFEENKRSNSKDKTVDELPSETSPEETAHGEKNKNSDIHAEVVVCTENAGEFHASL